MAQIMSMAMTVFMIIPIVAPGIGQLILFVAPWRWLFGALLIYGLIMMAWTLLRLPETLRPEHRRAFDASAIVSGFRESLRARQTLGYMAASTFFVGCLFGYITCCEQIFVDVFGLGAAFPLAFGALAIAISVGTFVNSRIVMRYGMRRISHAAMIWFTGMLGLLALLTALNGDHFWTFFAVMAAALSMFGLIGSNLNTLAMEPVGHVAGSASALFGAVTSTGGAVLGGLMARTFDGTTLPFTIALFLTGLATIAATLWTERGRLFVDAR